MLMVPASLLPSLLMASATSMLMSSSSPTCSSSVTDPRHPNVQYSPAECAMFFLAYYSAESVGRFGLGAELMMSCCVSAPGKALITGGYLILEPPSRGIVLASTSRFFCHVLEDETSSIDVQGGLSIIVHSPQFHQTYRYTLTKGPADEGTSHDVLTLRPLPSRGGDSVRNAMVEHTLLLCMSFVYEASCRGQTVWSAHGLVLTLRADNDFYSQSPHLAARGLPSTIDNLQSLPRFMECLVDGDGRACISKTGLGSSAALVSSMVAALLRFHGLVSLGAPGGPDIACQAGLWSAYALAQACHSAAQGKVGSGFDVSSAIFGSQVYSRSSTDLALAAVLDQVQVAGQDGSIRCQISTSDQAGSSALATMVTGYAVQQGAVKPFRLPSGFVLMMGDVCGGSDTPSMVRKVLHWKHEGGPHALGVWQELDAVNEAILDHMEQLCSIADTLEPLAALPSDAWGRVPGCAATLAQLISGQFRQARRLLREMGEEAGVPIEPPCQTELADATAALPGVVAAGVPGAGGYDAIFAILVHDSVRRGVEQLWCDWHKADTSRSRVAPLVGDWATEGLRLETFDLEQ